MCLVFFLLLSTAKSDSSAISWDLLINRTNDWSARLASDLRQKYQANSLASSVTTSCNYSLWNTLNALDNLDDWAVKMINSWGTFPPSGLSVGTTTDFGSYDQCVEIEANPTVGSPQYCLIDVRPPIPQPMPVHHNLHHRIDVTNTTNEFFRKHSEFASFYYWVSLRTGICVPSECDQKDVQLLANGFATDYGLELKQVRCHIRKEDSSLTYIQIAAMYAKED